MESLPPFLVELLNLSKWLVGMAIVFIPLERLFAVRRQKIFRRAFGIDVAYYFLTSTLLRFLMLLPLTLVAGLMHRYAPLDLYLFMEDVPDWARLSAAMVIGEIGAYWGHRWLHQFPFLWRFHAIHHSAQEIDWLVGAKGHPIDVAFERLCAVIPLYLLGLAQPSGQIVDHVPLIWSILGTGWGFFIHANLKWRLGWFEWLISSPAFHHWHHTNDGPELIDKNYAPMLPFIDKLFGTFYLPGHWPGKYGINDAIPASLAGQLIEPLVHIADKSYNPREELATHDTPQ